MAGEFPNLLDELLGTPIIAVDGVDQEKRTRVDFLNGGGAAVEKDRIVIDLAGVGTRTGILVDALRLIEGSTEGERRELKGYTTAGDGGQGTFQWRTGSGVDDGGTILNRNGYGNGAVGYWERVYSGKIDPRWFGCTNNGTECSTAAGRAVAATPNGGELRFGEGTFNCKFSVANKPGITISGLGKKTILTHAADPAGTAWNDGIITIETNSIGARVTNLQIQGQAIVPLNSGTLHSGSGPAGVSVTGTPVAREYWLFKITTGGALGAGKFDWSKDNGKTWDATGVTLAASVALGATGCTATFAAGVYVLNDTYAAVSTPGGGVGPTIQTGIVVQTGSNEVEIDQVLFAGTDASHGLNTCVVLNGVDDCQVHHNKITHIQGHDENDGTGYGFLASGSGHEIHHNRSEFPIGQGRHHIYLGPSAHCDVHHNRCLNGWYQQITVRAEAAQAEASYNSIHHNRCSNAQPLTSLLLRGDDIGAITIGQNAHHNEVFANLVISPFMRGIVVTDYGSVVAGETPNGNRVYGNKVFDPAATGVISEGANGSVLESNLVRNPGTGNNYNGVALLNSTLNPTPVRCTVHFNQVAQEGASAYRSAIGIGGGVTNASVHGNTGSTGTVAALEDAGTGTVIGTNILDGVQVSGSLEVGPTNVVVKTGVGSPEGAVTAAVGSVFFRQDGAAGTSFYVKESGSGNTGWIGK